MSDSDLYCSDCDEWFDDEDELDDHNEDNHHWCGKCDRFFAHEAALDSHLRASSKHNYCVDCERDFISKDALTQHLKSSSRHHYCASCEQDFESDTHLRTHLRSTIHKPRDLICPFRGCDKGFTDRSALVLHLESGKCGAGVNRITVNKFVRKWDTKHLITDRLLTSGNGSEAYDNEVETRYYATDAAFNGDWWECFLCHGEFSKSTALEQHLNSPRHQSPTKNYFCPLQTCQTHFRTLSGLLQHCESEGCGIKKFKKVEKTLEDLMGGMKKLKM